MRNHLIERRNHVEHHHFRSLASRLVVDRVVAARAPAPAMAGRTVLHRVEVPAAFPRVVQMTLRAQPVATTSRETPPLAMREQATAPRQQAPAAPRASLPALPPEELSRVSNFVIAELDRRVVSFRERTGRI